MLVRYCKECLFPETKPDLYFDENGVCDACLTAKKKHQILDSIDWKQREEHFESILQTARQKKPYGHNCIVPVSGGKDSFWQTFALKKIHNMRPLAVTFDQFDSPQIGKDNLDNLKAIGVDHVHYTLNPSVVKKLVYKGFKLLGDHYWVNHVGIYSVPFNIAKAFGIPLVVFGEQPQMEYGGPEASRDNFIMDKRWRQEFGLMRNFREEDMVDDEISIEDLEILDFPGFDVVNKEGILGTFYGFFHKWNARKHLEIAKECGFKEHDSPPPGAYLTYENMDMKFIEIRERQKYLKFGYGRATDQLNIDIRNNIISRKDALEIVKEIDGVVSDDIISEFCEYLEITEQEYFSIMDDFVNHDIFEKSPNNDWVLKNQRY